MFDCRAGDVSLFTRENIEKFVKTLVEKIDMVAYGEPMIEHFATHCPDKAGFSLCQMIETSNITAHFVDLNGDFYVNIFSCKPYEVQDALDVVRYFFNPENVKTRFIERQA